MKKIKRIHRVVLSLFFILTLLGSLVPSQVTSKAATYGDSLKNLNNKLTLGTTQTFSATGKVKHGTKSTGGALTTAKKVKIDYTITSSEPIADGDNLSVTFDVKFNFKDNPRITCKKFKYYGMGTIRPECFYTVFDYETGYNLEVKNDKGVNVTSGEWKSTWYGKQKYKVVTSKKANNESFKNRKTAQVSFTVSYPKTAENVCVGIGFINAEGNEFLPTGNGLQRIGKGGWADGYEIVDCDDDGNDITKPWKWGKTDYYKQGKNSVVYARLPKSTDTLQN